MAFRRCEEKENRRKSAWVLFSVTAERQIQVESDIRKFLRGESTFFVRRVFKVLFKVLFIFKLYQQNFLLQCIVQKYDNCVCSCGFLGLFSHPQ